MVQNTVSCSVYLGIARCYVVTWTLSSSAKKWSDLELWTLEPLISQILWQVALSSAKRPVGANFGGHHVTAKAPLTIAQRESLQKKRQDYLCISHHRISTQPGNLVVQR